MGVRTRLAASGNSTHLGTSITNSLAVIPFEELNVFSVISNSTVSALAFDSVARELSFTVSGPSGTRGYVKVIMAKNLVADVENIEVKLNDEEVGYTATALDDSWLVYFTYLHGVHEITINLGEVADRGPFPSTLVWFVIAIVVVVAVAGAALFAVYRKARR